MWETGGTLEGDRCDRKETRTDVGGEDGPQNAHDRSSGTTRPGVEVRV